MGITSSTPDVPSVAGAEREEGRSSLTPPNEGPAVGGPRRAGAGAGAGIEEDWASMATGNPAFWLKD